MDWPRRHETAGRAAARSQRRDVRLARDDCSLVLRAAQIELLEWERVELRQSQHQSQGLIHVKSLEPGLRRPCKVRFWVHQPIWPPSKPKDGKIKPTRGPMCTVWGLSCMRF